MKNFLNTIIGKQAYPIDNSQQYNIKTGEKSYLAGSAYGHEPKLVTIVSAPYNITYKSVGDREYTNEFVTVECEGELYTCLNYFYESEEKALEAHKRLIDQYASHLYDY